MGKAALLASMGFVSACGINAGHNDVPPGAPVLGFSTSMSSFDETDGDVEVIVSLSEPSPNVITFWVDFGGNAIAGEDYGGGGGLVLIPPDVPFATLHIFIADDGIPEAAETIEMTLTNADGAAIGAARHTLTIRENFSSRVTFDWAVVSAFESQIATATINVLPPSPVPIEVGYTISGTATAQDFTMPPAPLMIPANVASYELPIAPIDDDLDEDAETVIVTLVDPVNAILGETPTVTDTIEDNDPEVNYAFVAGQQTLVEGNSGMQLVTAEVRLDKAAGRTIEVNFGANAMTSASAGSDYQIMTASPLVFAPGVISQTITIAIYGDTDLDGSEVLALELAYNAKASRGYPYIHTIQINGDECYGSGTFVLCPEQVSTAAMTLPTEFFTSSGNPCAANQAPGWVEAGHAPACFIYGGDVTINSTRAMGDRPLVVFATGSITVNTLLDVGSHNDSYPRGAGGQPASCLPFGAAAGPAAGGAGGSFVTAGGSGGNHGSPSGAGGVAAPAGGAPTRLRGGCQGQVGDPSYGGRAGHGGGAVYLIALGSITIAPGAAINASGAPGTGGRYGIGGNGGGSGGMIMLWAGSIQASMARLVANGAGGGEGSPYPSDGGTGSEVDITAPLTPAAGGSGTSGGDGGAGAVQGIAASNGSSANNNNGGGAGGGGLGFIATHQPLNGVIASPTPTMY